METETRASFGALLRGYRLACGLTQEALAEAAGLSRDAINLLERGARLLGAVDSALGTIGAKLYFGDRFESDCALRLLRASLNEDAFAKAWVESQAMTLEQAVAYALDGDQG